jgi:hypothetical protein
MRSFTLRHIFSVEHFGLKPEVFGDLDDKELVEIASSFYLNLLGVFFR